MHAGVPFFYKETQNVFKLGNIAEELPDALEALGGTLLSNGIAIVMKLGFGYVMRDSLIEQNRSDKAMKFFEDNFVFTDPNAPDGKRYYQGKFLIRTRKDGDELNVYLKFCDKPDELFIDNPFDLTDGPCLNPLAVVTSEALTEKEADIIERDPDKVDLVMSFKDIASLLKLAEKTEVDGIGLLLENIVQIKGNVGHLFKLGAIATETTLALELPKQ